MRAADTTKCANSLCARSTAVRYRNFSASVSKFVFSVAALDETKEALV